MPNKRRYTQREAKNTTGRLAISKPARRGFTALRLRTIANIITTFNKTNNMGKKEEKSRNRLLCLLFP